MPDDACKCCVISLDMLGKSRGADMLAEPIDHHIWTNVERKASR